MIFLVVFLCFVAEVIFKGPLSNAIITQDRAYSRPLLGATIALHLVPSVMKKIFFIRNGKI